MLNIKFMANEYDADIVPKTTYETLSYKLDETGVVDFKFRCDDITFDKIGQCNRRVYAELDGVDVTSSLESVTAKDLYYIEIPFENNEETKTKIIEKFKAFFDEYSYGRTVYLKAADASRIKISLQDLNFSSSLSVKIKEMNDEKIKYVRLYAVGENVKIPVVKERSVAVWKLDDLQMPNSAIRGFEKAYNYFSQYGIKAGDEDFEKFESSFKSKKGKDIILQSHPWGWDDKDLEVIDKITKVLVAEDYAFMTPQEYYEYCQKRKE